MIQEIRNNLLSSAVYDVLVVWGSISIFRMTVSIIGLLVQTLNLLFNSKMQGSHYSIKSNQQGAWVAQSVKRPPSAQVMISGSWDRVLHWASCSAGSLLLPLPLLLSLLILALNLYQINIFFKKSNQYKPLIT